MAYNPNNPNGQAASASSAPVVLANEQVQDMMTASGAQSTISFNIFLPSASAGTTSTDSVAGTPPVSYRSFYTQITGSAGTTAGAVIFEGSNDNTTFNPLTVYDDAVLTGVPINAATTITLATTRFFSGKTTYRYVRCRISTAPVAATLTCATRFSITDYVPRVNTVGQGTAANLNATVVQATAANLLANVGGSAAVAAAASGNPVRTAGVDTSSLVRSYLSDVQGLQVVAGPGEFTSFFSLGTGAAAVTDGTNGKTFNVTPRESDVYVGFSAISTTPTFQLEGSYDNITFSVIPMTRIDSTAASLQYASAAAFTPVLAAVYKAKNYGYPILRAHLTAGTTSNTVGLIRNVPTPEVAGVVVSPFALTAASTSEAVGTANGSVQTGGVRTINISGVRGQKAYLYADAITGTLTYAAETAPDGVTFTAAAMQPIAGGATVTSVAATGTAALPAAGTYVVDLNGATAVRVHCTAYTSGTMFGALKIVNVPNASDGSILTKVASTAQEASHVLKASAGKLISLVGYNNSATAQYIQLFDSATVPADTTVPVYSFYVQGTSNFSLDNASIGIPFTTGIAVSNSSTLATKTIGSANCWFTAVVQ